MPVAPTKSCKRNLPFSSYSILSVASMLLCLCSLANAERLPVKSYTTADGLAHNVVNRIVRDSRGFLWLCTEEGLSRFDGYKFTNYGTLQGLPHSTVNDILETRSGQYWLATNSGVVLFNPQGTPMSRIVYANDRGTDSPMFMTVVPEDEDRYARAITTLLEARDGTIWCGTLKGLYRLDARDGHFALLPENVGMPSDFSEQRYVYSLAEDRFGSLWVATPSGLYKRSSNGSSAHYTRHDGLPSDFLQALLIDDQGQLWIGTRDLGFFRATYDATNSPPAVALMITPHDFEQSEWVSQLFQTSDHKLWAATARGLLEYLPEGDGGGKSYRFYTTKNGLTDHNISALEEDADGNLWLGSAAGMGAMKLVRNGFVAYDEQDGVNSIFSIFADRAGGVCFRGYVLGDKHASVFDGGKLDLLNASLATYWHELGRFDGQHIEWFMPSAIKGSEFGWVDEGVTLQSRNGEWWIVSGRQLYHFPASDSFLGIKTAHPISVFTTESVIGMRQVFRLFEDSHQRVWVSIVASEGNGLALWEPESQKLRDLTGSQNLPSLHDNLARAFAEDTAGDVWIGLSTGVARFRDGSFTVFGSQDGVPQGGITDIYTDHAGRLWLASTRSGLVRVDNPNAEHPTFTDYTTTQGLSSNVVSAVTEDLFGRIYAGTGQGLDRLDPQTGHIKHYTTADGFTGGKVFAAFRAPDGSVWIGTSRGLSRFHPEAERQTSPPPVLLTGVQVAGATQNVSAIGTTQIQLPDLPSSASQLQIDFVGLGFAPGESLRYQYMLEGADSSWGVPTAQRTVTYARLASGRYRFLVRAVNTDGAVSAAPAVVMFRVLPPLWARWWFLSIASLAVLVAAYMLYRYRVARLLELANMRTRIATDLHDDIGSGLSRVAILSEVVKQQTASSVPQSGPMLAEIADSARVLVDTMRDIVWAIAPQHDDLGSVIYRVRQFAFDLLEPKHIKVDFSAAPELEHVKLDPEQRRHLFLICKEAINNVSRHANCTKVTLHISASGNWLTVEISDNGCGFSTPDNGEPSTNGRGGHGLKNMRGRADELGGHLELDTRPGSGTDIKLRLPLRKR